MLPFIFTERFAVRRGGLARSMWNVQLGGSGARAERKGIHGQRRSAGMAQVRLGPCLALDRRSPTWQAFVVIQPFAAMIGRVGQPCNGKWFQVVYVRLAKADDADHGSRREARCPIQETTRPSALRTKGSTRAGYA